MSEPRLPDRARHYPPLRLMGSKHRLLPWIHRVLEGLDFETALDAFSGSGAVAYLMKSMDRAVTANDLLGFPAAIAHALIENPGERVGARGRTRLLAYDPRHPHFIERTFRGIFFTPEELRFLDRTRWNLGRLRSPHRRAVALAALIRSCAKRQPRGVFTVAGDPARYKDGRRDLRLTLREHFVEQLAVYDECAFANGRRNRALRGDVFSIDPDGFDLVYLDPPYVPRADDNCYTKRYHFLEGLASYWSEGEILWDTRTRKLRKPYTPFSYRRDALDAFDRLFHRFRRSTLVLSYSSNGYPDRDALVALMERHKRRVDVHEREHRYHFGTHGAVRRERAAVREYLIVGR